MFWNSILLFLLIICTGYTLYILYKNNKARFINKTRKCHRHSYENPDGSYVLNCIEKNEGCRVIQTQVEPNLMFWLVFLVPCALFLIISIPITAVQQQVSNDVENSFYVLEELTSQRDAILNEFDEILDNEDFVQLMNAAVPEDVKFLRNNPEVTGFLLGRADRVVAINGRLFSERNRVLSQSKSVCNYTNNPLVPMVPFLRPDCNLGDILEVTQTQSLEE